MKPEKYFVNVRMDTIADLTEKRYRKVLEIGGGNFSTLSRILDMHPDASGFGIDMVDMCDDTRIKVVVGSLDTPDVFDQLGEAEFDLIIANDVLEHLVNPGMVLEHPFKLAARSAHIHISVPNIRQIRSFYHIFVTGKFPQDDSGLFDRTHLSWFCRRDIVALVETSGFRVIDSYMKGRYVPDIARRTRAAELLGLQSIVIATKPDA